MLIALAAVIACGVLWYATSRGMSLSNDSLKYAQAARSIASGHGSATVSVIDGVPTYEPITWWPAGYPAVIGSLGWVAGVDPLVVNKPLHVILFTTLILLAAGMTWHATRRVQIDGVRSLWPAAVAAWLLLCSHRLLQVYVAAWSEPIFITLVLLTLWAVATHVARPRWQWPVLIGLGAGLAYLVRYAGLPLVIGSAGLLLVLGSWHVRHWKRRLIDAAIAGGVASIAVVGWMIRNNIVGGPPGGRDGSNGRTRQEQLDYFVWNTQLAWDGIVDWFWADPMRSDPRLPRLLAMVAAVVVAFAFAWWRSRHKSTRAEITTPSTEPWMLSTLVLAGLGYFAFIGVAQSTVAFGKMDYRVMSPLNAIVLIIAAIGIARLSHLVRLRASSRGIMLAMSFVLATCVLLNVVRSGRYVVKLASERHEDSGGPKPRPIDSPVTAWALEMLPPGAWVLTHGDARKSLSGRGPLLIAKLPSRGKQLDDDAADRLSVGLRQTGGVVIVYDDERDDYLPTMLAEQLNLQPLPRRDGDDATVLVPVDPHHPTAYRR